MRAAFPAHLILDLVPLCNISLIEGQCLHFLLHFAFHVKLENSKRHLCVRELCIYNTVAGNEGRKEVTNFPCHRHDTSRHVRRLHAYERQKNKNARGAQAQETVKIMSLVMYDIF
jgi:hypothetical protein